MTDDQRRDLGIAYHVGLLKLERGIANDEDWGTCAVCIRLGMRFAQTGNGADDAQLLINAHDALMSCEQRYKKTGKYLFTGEELRRVQDGMNAHDRQMERTSYHTVSRLLVELDIDLRGDIESERMAA